jgi:hypothetical protein
LFFLVTGLLLFFGGLAGLFLSAFSPTLFDASSGVSVVGLVLACTGFIGVYKSDIESKSF